MRPVWCCCNFYLGTHRTKNELSPDNAAFYHSYGFGCTRRSNMHFVDCDTVISAQGNTVVFLDIISLKKTYMFGVSGRGIGALALK